MSKESGFVLRGKPCTMTTGRVWSCGYDFQWRFLRNA